MKRVDRHMNKADWGRLIVRQMLVCLAFVISFSQLSAVSHAHPSHDDEPNEPACSVCILATHDEDIEDNVGDGDRQGDMNTCHFDAQLSKSGLALSQAQPARVPTVVTNLFAPARVPILTCPAPRAPPIYI